MEFWKVQIISVRSIYRFSGSKFGCITGRQRIIIQIPSYRPAKCDICKLIQSQLLMGIGIDFYHHTIVNKNQDYRFSMYDSFSRINVIAYRGGCSHMTNLRFVTIILFGAIALFMTGCATADSNTAGGTSEAAIQKDQGSTPLYREFGDVLIPSEMDPVPDSSFIYSTSGFTAGVLTIKGRVDTESLIAFFENNMAKDNWKMVSVFKSPKSIMMFRKETRWSVINIHEETFNTYAEIWVAPTAGNSDLLK